MNILILFHSVCGNTYSIANKFYQEFSKTNNNVVIKKVHDEDYETLANKFNDAKDFNFEMNNIKEANLEDLINADLVLFGSPTYYGNMSSELKAFLDSCAIFYDEQPLKGKYCAFFTSGGSSQGGSVYCLEAMIRFAQHNGMLPISIPASIQATCNEISAYGICHTSLGMNGKNRLSKNLEEAIKEITKYLLSTCK
ncbi:MAG: flavodoxin family protein [Alphaproteobacteria bacterium]|nr:flavodoxin family protein [Alphaproteobacteria bacterium]